MVFHQPIGKKMLVKMGIIFPKFQGPFGTKSFPQLQESKVKSKVKIQGPCYETNDWNDSFGKKHIQFTVYIYVYIRKYKYILYIYVCTVNAAQDFFAVQHWTNISFGSKIQVLLNSIKLLNPKKCLTHTNLAPQVLYMLYLDVSLVTPTYPSGSFL